MTDKATKLTHPDAPKAVVETNNPQPYISQGWVEVKPDEKSEPKK